MLENVGNMLGSCRVCRDQVCFLLDSCWNGNLVFFMCWKSLDTAGKHLLLLGVCMKTLDIVGKLNIHVGNYWTILGACGKVLERCRKFILLLRCN